MPTRQQTGCIDLSVQETRARMIVQHRLEGRLSLCSARFLRRIGDIYFRETGRYLFYLYNIIFFRDPRSKKRSRKGRIQKKREKKEKQRTPGVSDAIAYFLSPSLFRHLIKARVRVRERDKCREALTLQLENQSIESALRTAPNKALFFGRAKVQVPRANRLPRLTNPFGSFIFSFFFSSSFFFLSRYYLGNDQFLLSTKKK